MSMTFHFLENSAVGAKKRLEIVSDFYQLTWIDFLKKHSRSTNERPTAECLYLTLGLRLGLDAHKHVHWRWDAYLSVKWKKFYEALRMFGTDFQTAFQDPNKSYPRGLRGQLTLAAADLRWRFGLRILSAIILGKANLSRALRPPCILLHLQPPNLVRLHYRHGRCGLESLLLALIQKQTPKTFAPKTLAKKTGFSDPSRMNVSCCFLERHGRLTRQ
jgi:hypothetical protein